MEPKTVSVILHYYRKKYKLNQEDICGGICSITTLSRIEKGERNVDSLMVENLLDRMGKEVALFETMLNKADYELWKVRNEIEHIVSHFESDTVYEKIKEYRKVMPKDEKIHEQFCLYYEIILDIKNKLEDKTITEKILQAIHMTRPDYEKKEFIYQLYSKTEIKLLLLYMDYKKKEKNLLERELLNLLKFVDHYYSQRQKEEIGSEIIRRLINCQDEKKDNEKIISYAEKGISMLVRGRGIKNLGEFYFVKVQASERLYRDDKDWDKIKEEWYKECKMAYYLFLLEGKEKEQEKIQNYCTEVLKCQTIEQGILFD